MMENYRNTWTLNITMQLGALFHMFRGFGKPWKTPCPGAPPVPNAPAVLGGDITLLDGDLPHILKYQPFTSWWFVFGFLQILNPPNSNNLTPTLGGFPHVL